MEHGKYLKMNSELIFKHIKNNILRYTVTFSAIVHVIGYIVCTSCGTEPDLTKEKIIKVKTIMPLPDKPAQKIIPEQEKNFKREQPKKIRRPEPLMARMRERTPMAKIAKAVAPSPVVKKTPATVNRLNKTYKSMKIMQQTLSTISPSANLKKYSQINISHVSPIKPRTMKTERSTVKSLSKITHRQISKSLLAVNHLKTQSSARLVAFKSDLSPSHPASHTRKMQQLNRKFTFGPTVITGFAPMVVSKQEMNIEARSPENFDTQVHRSTERATPITGFTSAPPQPASHARKTQHLSREFTPGPTEIAGIAPIVASKQEINIEARSPENFDTQVHRSTERATPITEFTSASPSGPVNLMQMSSIPAGFNEIFSNGEDRANDNTISKTLNSSGEKENVNAVHLGRIKLAFSSQVRTKIAQTKYYPPTARRRGYEGEPVVTFILGNTGDLLEVSIENPSRHKLLNEAALDAVKSASPYPPIPELLKVKTLRFNLPISFILEGP
jgi:TonB family protein